MTKRKEKCLIAEQIQAARKKRPFSKFYETGQFTF